MRELAAPGPAKMHQRPLFLRSGREVLGLTAVIAGSIRRAVGGTGCADDHGA